MSEKLLDRQLTRLTEQVTESERIGARARAELDQAGELLTALGVPMTTDPASEDRTGGIMEAMTRATPRRLSLTERIMALAEFGPDSAHRLSKDQAPEHIEP